MFRISLAMGVALALAPVAEAQTAATAGPVDPDLACAVALMWMSNATNRYVELPDVSTEDRKLAQGLLLRYRSGANFFLGRYAGRTGGKNVDPDYMNAAQAFLKLDKDASKKEIQRCSDLATKELEELLKPALN